MNPINNQTTIIAPNPIETIKDLSSETCSEAILNAFQKLTVAFSPLKNNSNINLKLIERQISDLTQKTELLKSQKISHIKYGNGKKVDKKEIAALEQTLNGLLTIRTQLAIQAQKISNLGRFPECAICLEPVIEKDFFTCASNAPHTLHDTCAYRFANTAQGDFLNFILPSDLREGSTFESIIQHPGFKIEVKCPTCKYPFEKPKLLKNTHPIQESPRSALTEISLTILDDTHLKIRALAIGIFFGAVSSATCGFFTSGSIPENLLFGAILGSVSPIADKLVDKIREQTLYLTPFVPQGMVPLLLEGPRLMALGTSVALEYGLLSRLCGFSTSYPGTFGIHYLTGLGTILGGIRLSQPEPHLFKIEFSSLAFEKLNNLCIPTAIFIVGIVAETIFMRILR